MSHVEPPPRPAPLSRELSIPPTPPPGIPLPPRVPPSLEYPTSVLAGAPYVATLHPSLPGQPVDPPLWVIPHPTQRSSSHPTPSWTPHPFPPGFSRCPTSYSTLAYLTSPQHTYQPPHTHTILCGTQLPTHRAPLIPACMDGQPAPPATGEWSPSPGGPWWHLVPQRGCRLGRVGSPSACQRLWGGRNSPFLDLLGRPHHAHEFLMPAGKGHRQFPYHISLPNHPCFQEGGQDPLTAGKKGVRGGLAQPHSQTLVPKGAQEPLRVYSST